MDQVHALQIPTHYVRQLRKRVNVDGHINCLKSHDYHVLMQQVYATELRDVSAILCPHVFLTLKLIKDLGVWGFLKCESNYKHDALELRHGFNLVRFSIVKHHIGVT